MKIKLNKLAVKGFKGIDDFTLEIGGENATLIGENGTGKTSVADAFYWLLTDSNLERKSKFGIIKNDHEKAQVEAEIFIGSKLIRPKKIYRPADKGGYTTDHFIDGMEMTQKEYKKELSLPDELRLVSDVHFFMSLPIAKRRDLIFSLIGKIKDNNIFKEYEHLKPVKQILNGRDFLKVRKSLTDGVKSLEKELKEIPVEIRTHQSMMPAPVKKSLKSIEKDIDKLDGKIADIKHGGKTVKRIALLEAELISLEANIRVQYEAKEEKLRTRRLQIKTVLVHNNNTISEETQAIENKNERIYHLKNEIDTLEKRWKEQRAMKYKPAKVCYACGQVLPEDKITRQEDEFNKERAETIRQIEIEGKQLRSNVNELSKQLPVHAETIESIQEDIDKLEVELNEIEKRIEDLQKRMDKEIREKQEKIQSQIEALKVDDQKSDLYELQAEKSKLEANKLAIVQAEKTQKAIDKLEKKRKEIAEEIEQIEKNVWLLDEFNRKKAEYIEGIINDRFDITDWKLFEILQNGNIRDICEPFFDGVPYLDLNTGAKINIGLDIVNTFASHHDVNFPVFIDNSESITSWIPTNCQLIGLMAMKGEKQLRLL